MKDVTKTEIAELAGKFGVNYSGRVISNASVELIVRSVEDMLMKAVCFPSKFPNLNDQDLMMARRALGILSRE